MPAQLKNAAVTGFAQSDLYDKYRPSYPAAAVDKLLDAIKIASFEGGEVLDLAAGTGKFTELLANRPEKYVVKAVEPHPDMRDTLERKKLERVTVQDGLSTKIPAEDECFDAIIAAQAFHWMADQDSLAEMHRVLRSGAYLGMIWNIEDYNQTRDAKMSSSWESKMRDLVWSLPDDDQPRFRHAKWQAVFDSQLKRTPFPIALSNNSLFSLPIGRDEVKWEVWLSKEALWSRYRTLSQIAILEGKELEQFRQKYDDIIDNGNDVNKNELGEIAVHGTTFFAWTFKIPESAPPL